MVYSVTWGDDDPRPDNSYAAIPAQIIDQPSIRGPISKARLEDIHLYSFLQALVLDRQAAHPIEVSVGYDPPDRIIRDANGRTQGLELTQLTISSIRHELAEARKFGRAVETGLRGDQAVFEHLKGRHVIISIFPAPSPPMPRIHAPLVQEVLEALKVDRGTLNDDDIPAEGLPNIIGPDGVYGSIGPVGIGVGQGGWPDDFTVLSSAQVELERESIHESLSAILTTKDRPGNDTLLISVAAPDSLGTICPADQVLFHFLHEDIRDGKFSPPNLTHIKTVYIHQWGSRQWFQYGIPPSALSRTPAS